MIPKMNEYKKKWQIESENNIKPGLTAIKEALLILGEPQKKLKVIHVTGTNGKGSTIAFMEGILKAHGYSTGVFSSPAIHDMHDQIRINGELISEQELNLSFKKIREAKLSGKLTDFELLTVVAFVTFEKIQPDFILLETGMGARFDSTNVVLPIVSVITSIALEHESFLGTTIQEVAYHKAGIIKENVPIITGLLEEDTYEVIRLEAEKFKSPLISLGRQRFKGLGLYNLKEIKMKGEHQLQNATIAIEALLEADVKLLEDRVEQALSTIQLPHRFEEIAPGIFLDGAHNPAAAKVLANTIRAEFPGEKVDFIIGMLMGKDLEKTLDELIPVANSFSFINFEHPRAEKAEELMRYCNYYKKSVTNEKSDTILLVRADSHKKIVTGSLYLLATLLPIER